MVRGDRAARPRQPGFCRLLPATTATGACELSGAGPHEAGPQTPQPSRLLGLMQTREGCKDYKPGKWWAQPGGTRL